MRTISSLTLLPSLRRIPLHHIHPLLNMSSASSSKLFQPIKFGDVTLQHRIVMAPLTRFRANERHAHTELGVEYYTQRASVPGTLIIVCLSSTHTCMWRCGADA